MNLRVDRTNLSCALCVAILLAATPQTVARGGIKLKAATPHIDYSAPNAKLQGRIEQIASAQPGTKLPAQLTVAASPEQKLQSESAGVATLKSGAKLQAEAAAVAVSKQNRKLTGAAATSNERFLLSLRRADHSIWGGTITMSVSQSYKSDPSLALRIPVGDRGAVVLRFVPGADPVPKLHPTLLFFPGRDIPYRQSFEQQQIGDEDSGEATTNRSRSMIYKVGQFLSPLTNWILPASEPPPVHYQCLYVPLGEVKNHNLQGEKFQQHIVHDTVKELGTDAFEEDIVSEHTSNDSAAITSYSEIVVRLVKHDQNTALAKIAKVEYGADRTILRRKMFEGWVSTDWQPAADQICGYTNLSWDKTVSKFGL